MNSKPYTWELETAPVKSPRDDNIYLFWSINKYLRYVEVVGLSRYKIAKADRLFSEYVRLKNADAYGYVRCISCGKPTKWKEADCGHYISRKYYSTRWHDDNAWPQCVECNRHLGGSIASFKEAIRYRIGDERLSKLEALRHEYFMDDIDELIISLQASIKQLKDVRG